MVSYIKMYVVEKIAQNDCKINRFCGIDGWFISKQVYTIYILFLVEPQKWKWASIFMAEALAFQVCPGPMPTKKEGRQVGYSWDTAS